MVAQGSEIMECLTGHIHGHRAHLMARYYAALMLRRFVILAGPPGVDKMGLARGLAAALAGRLDEQWCLFQAHPWWTTQAAGASHLVEVHERFKLLKLSEFIAAARTGEAAGRPFFVGIEQMSPAEVVCYFEDLPRGLLWSPDATAVPIALPRNLYVTGTLDAADTGDLNLPPEVCRQAAVVRLDCVPAAALGRHAREMAIGGGT